MLECDTLITANVQLQPQHLTLNLHVFCKTQFMIAAFQQKIVLKLF